MLATYFFPAAGSWNCFSKSETNNEIESTLVATWNANRERSYCMIQWTRVRIRTVVQICIESEKVRGGIVRTLRIDEDHDIWCTCINALDELDSSCISRATMQDDKFNMPRVAILSHFFSLRFLVLFSSRCSSLFLELFFS